MFLTVFKTSLLFEEDDDAGISIELNSDFLLSAANVVVRSSQTGQVVSDERREGNARVIIPKLEPGNYDVLIYTHKCVTNMQSGFIEFFDLLLELRMKPIRLSDGHKD